MQKAFSLFLKALLSANCIMRFAYNSDKRSSFQFIPSSQADRIGAMPNIAVIGAGVNGVASAIKILEHYVNDGKTPIKVTIISEDFTPNTTGDGSAGLWGPYLLGGTSQAKV